MKNKLKNGVEQMKVIIDFEIIKEQFYIYYELIKHIEHLQRNKGYILVLNNTVLFYIEIETIEHYYIRKDWCKPYV